MGHILDKIIVIWFFQTRTIFLSKFVAGHVTKMWFFKIMNYLFNFWTQILHLNFKENFEKMMWWLLQHIWA